MAKHRPEFDNGQDPVDSSSPDYVSPFDGPDAVIGDNMADHKVAGDETERVGAWDYTGEPESLYGWLTTIGGFASFARGNREEMILMERAGVDLRGQKFTLEIDLAEADLIAFGVNLVGFFSVAARDDALALLIRLVEVNDAKRDELDKDEEWTAKYRAASRDLEEQKFADALGLDRYEYRDAVKIAQEERARQSGLDLN